jgi:hypothetical protein
MKILNTEIIDNAVEQERQISETEYEKYIQPSEISVLVKLEHDGKTYFLDYQSTATSDYGAYSSHLKAYGGADDYDKLMCQFDDEEDFYSFLYEVKKESNAQQIRDDYVEENYQVDDGDYGGMDANSEINKAVKK